MALPEGIERAMKQFIRSLPGDEDYDEDGSALRSEIEKLVKREKELRETMTACRGVLAMFVDQNGGTQVQQMFGRYCALLDAPPNMKGTEDATMEEADEAGQLHSGDSASRSDRVDRVSGSPVAHQEGEAKQWQAMVGSGVKVLARKAYFDLGRIPQMVKDGKEAEAHQILDAIRDQIAEGAIELAAPQTEAKPSDTMTELEVRLSRLIRHSVEGNQRSMLDDKQAIRSLVERLEGERDDKDLDLKSALGALQKAEIRAERLEAEKSTAIRKAVIEELKRADKHMLDSEDWDDHGYLIGRITQVEEEDGDSDVYNPGPVMLHSRDRDVPCDYGNQTQSVAPTGYEGASIDNLMVPLETSNYATELRRRLEAGEAAQRALDELNRSRLEGGRI